MNKFTSATLLLYFVAVVAQLLTWADLSGAERSTCVVAVLLVGALLMAILRFGGARGNNSPPTVVCPPVGAAP
ncbi:hypothetical protein G9U53_33030 [Rhodococcus sp. D-46]|uniref:hypothetical protein n=1 Tax=Rhodococcus TaxID=1827 RepID=UPI0013F5F163|nr:hypothetical protein [Rhodococcus qingshengii]NHE69124.1 hypothetical protein [Rhodococcus sp. D-46]QXC46570.1 hypothetical protein KSE96_30470 [Rhodococcus qingshengii]